MHLNSQKKLVESAIIDLFYSLLHPCQRFLFFEGDMSHQEFIQSFEKVPKELFRLITGPSIRIRAKPGPLRPQGSFDLLTYDGKVQPKALNPETYQCERKVTLSPSMD